MIKRYHNVLSKEFKPHISPIKDDIQLRRNPDYFWATGTQVYIGRQGEGKTISAVKHMLDLKKRHPKAIIVTNLALKCYKPRILALTPEQSFQVENASPRAAEAFATRYLDANLKSLLSDFNVATEYIQFSTMDELATVLTKVNNDHRGVIYIIDEIHTYLNALESKNIPMYIFTEISQQRKQRKAIIGTSQLFMRVAKPIREQCDNVIKCHTTMGIFTTQKAFDGATVEQDLSGHLIGNRRRFGYFFHTRKLRQAFDTYQKVVSGAEQYENQMNVFELNKKNIKVLNKG